MKRIDLKNILNILIILPLFLLGQVEKEFSETFRFQNGTSSKLVGVFDHKYYMFLKADDGEGQLISFKENSLEMKDIHKFDLNGRGTYKVLDIVSFRDTAFSYSIQEEEGRLLVGPMKVDSNYSSESKLGIDFGQTITRWRQNIQFIKSRNQSNAVFYADNRNESESYQFDLAWYQFDQDTFIRRSLEFDIKNKDSRVIKMQLSNNGILYILFQERNPSVEKEEKGRYTFKLLAYDLNKGDFKVIKRRDNEVYLGGMNFILDERRNELVLVGLYSIQSYAELTGLKKIRLKMNSLEEEELIKRDLTVYELRKMGAENIADNNKGLEDFNLKDLVLRSDGGISMIGEISFKTVVESSNSNVYLNPYAGSERVYQNNQNIYFMSFDSSMELSWNVSGIKRQSYLVENGAELMSFKSGVSDYGLYAIYNKSMTEYVQLELILVDPSGLLKKHSLMRDKVDLESLIQISENEFIALVELNEVYRLLKVTLNNAN